MQLDIEEIKRFQNHIKTFYSTNPRHMAWREPETDGTFDPYKILVSEIMLQQTQVGRVEVKYGEFIDLFPDMRSLATATLDSVLRSWSGLGYNRRAKYLHETAKLLSEMESFPRTVDQLARFPGIGKNTAAAILVYSFNQAEVFIETNIRSVYFSYFYPEQATVSDKELEELVAQTVDDQNPREWYWSLMDYGAFLKQNGNARLSQSKHYKKQSKFAGSMREIRGKILRELLIAPSTRSRLNDVLKDKRVNEIIDQLGKEGLLSISEDSIRLAE